MDTRFFTTASLLVILLLLSGCWKQDDVISIAKDGAVTFKSTVVITADDLSFKDVETLSSDYEGDLVRAGWKVQRKWLSKSTPFTLVFTGQGNLHSVAKVTEFYEIRKAGANMLTIMFKSVEGQGGKSSRTIRFQNPSVNEARIEDERGKEVTGENVTSDKNYRVIF